MLSGCTSAPETTKSNEAEETEVLHRYERTFHPSDYEVDLPAPESEKNGGEETPREESTSRPAGKSEIVPGFRVQIAFSEDIDFANQLKAEVSPRLPNQWVYVVYEAPYYKVRVGDFTTRPDANPVLKLLVDLGYKDAWIVPDKVLGSPHAKPQEPPPPPPEEER